MARKNKGPALATPSPKKNDHAGGLISSIPNRAKTKSQDAPLSVNDLTDMPRWVAWREEAVKDKPTKIPYAPDGHKARIPTDPSTWGTRKQAERSWQKLKGNGRKGGVGIVLGDLDDDHVLLGVDLDDCFDADGCLYDWADDVVERFDTYTEVSPSHQGVKLFFLVATEDEPAIDNLLGGKTRKKFGVGDHREIAIDRARYYAVTDDKLEDTPDTMRIVGVEDVRWFIEEAGPRYQQRYKSTSKDETSASSPVTRDESGSGYGFRFLQDLKRRGWTYEAARAAILKDQGKAGEWAHRKDERDIRRAWDNAQDGGPPKLPPKVEAKLDGLADLHPLEYESERKDAAKDLGMRVEVLDKEVERRREDRVVLPFLEDEEPWHEPVAGSELLDEFTETIGRYVDMPQSPRRACALWALFTHVHDAFWFSPILGITSPAPECGKTTLLAALHGLTAKGVPASNLTGPVIYRAVDLWSPTLLIDEGDTFLNREDLRGILDSGHNRTAAYVLRCEGDDMEPRKFSTWAPKAVARIGRLSATLASRSIPINLKRALPDTAVERQPRDPKATFETLRRRAIRWAVDNFNALSEAKPDLPDVLGFRDQDNWEPLLAIADACGLEWGKRARAAAVKMSTSTTHIDDSMSLGVMLLEDIRDIFEEREVERTAKTNKPYKAISSAALAAWLAEREDRPWAEFGRQRKPITPRGIAALLQGFSIRPKQIPNSRSNGYWEKQFIAAWRRYLSS